MIQTRKRHVSNTEGNKIFVNFTKKWNKYQYGVALSFLADKEKYEDYCPIYIQLATKNSQTKPISMQVDVTNILDVYGLTVKCRRNWRAGVR
jgi:hypothetical protein